jgi:uncharacterized protein (TIGR01777 family)
MGRVVVAGGSGYIGTALVAALEAGGHEVVVLTRSPETRLSTGRAVCWDPAGDGPWQKELAGAAAVVNLAGSSIGKGPWTTARRAEILDSRLRATGALVRAIASLPAADRPAALISASGIDYYGDRGEEVVDEHSDPGTSFLATVCTRWEAAARQAEELGVRVALLRTGLVLSRDSVALRLMALPFRLFAGGPVGSGRQWVSWIHLQDVVGLYSMAVERPLAGPMNLVTPHSVRNAEFAAEMARILGRPGWLRAPAALLRTVLGQQADLLLHGRRVEPTVASAQGYRYAYPGLREALESSLR